MFLHCIRFIFTQAKSLELISPFDIWMANLHMHNNHMHTTHEQKVGAEERRGKKKNHWLHIQSKLFRLVTIKMRTFHIATV